MKDERLPLTVIGGYLGAGKTTLINRLLSEANGRKLMVLVNDFGAINIDASLIENAGADTLTLTNGCVCCTMGADLFIAMGDVLDRAERPDHLIIEASGVADPQRIANAAMAEPDMRYCGIVTVVDGKSASDLLDNPQVGPQICAQIEQADLLLITKTATIPTILGLRLSVLNRKAIVTQTHRDLETLILEDRPFSHPQQTQGTAHAAYQQWSYTGTNRLAREDLLKALKGRPEPLFRFKGFVRGTGEMGWLVQVVGQDIDISTIPQPEETQLVAIGLAQVFSTQDCNAWWDTVLSASATHTSE